MLFLPACLSGAFSRRDGLLLIPSFAWLLVKGYVLFSSSQQTDFLFMVMLGDALDIYSIAASLNR